MIQSFQFYERDATRGFVGAGKWVIQGAGGPMAMLGRMKQNGAWPADLWGEKFCATMKEAIGHTIEWAVVPEDLPEETNYVDLDPVLTDSDGLPAPRVHYKVSENTRRLMQFHLERTLEAQYAAGAKRAWIKDAFYPSGHNLGTAKMGNDPRTSVVNGYGRTHDVPNLYIVDGSVFTTSTGVNPTATICAIAKRTAAHIVDEAKVRTTGVA
jgi:choline dehydrogenase-like flavoprotein